MHFRCFIHNVVGKSLLLVCLCLVLSSHLLDGPGTFLAFGNINVLEAFPWLQVAVLCP